ncbi:hypothetical protein C8R48DRAFT_779205 [Suillus tomentosus]|nr:hypothetical protein C8R48DRAFT_779205 [Suillus tomentosus]
MAQGGRDGAVISTKVYRYTRNINPRVYEEAAASICSQMSETCSPSSEDSTLESAEYVADPNVVRMLVTVLTTRHGQPPDRDTRYTPHGLKLTVTRIYFATPAAFAPQGADTSKYRCFRELQDYVKGSMLPNAQPAHADTCVSEASFIERKHY